MATWEWVTTAVVLVGAAIFTIVWRMIGEKWADAEHKSSGPKDLGGKEQVVIKMPPKDGKPHQAMRRPGTDDAC